jgi:hypothetical protein
MGSMATDFPVPYTTVMLNSLEIIGQFMYSPGAARSATERPQPGCLGGLGPRRGGVRCRAAASELEAQ